MSVPYFMTDRVCVEASDRPGFYEVWLWHASDDAHIVLTTCRKLEEANAFAQEVDEQVRSWEQDRPGRGI
jgi:hypothetical protein